MPKMKTKRALAKRVKLTATGKLLRKSAFTSHLAQNKTRKQKKQLAKGGQIAESDRKRLHGLLQN